MFRKRQNRPLVSSVYFRFFRVTTILFRHNSRRPKTRRPRASWFIVASRTSRSRRARISVFQRCARTRRLSSPHVHRSSVERLARDLKHEKRPRLFVSCEGRCLDPSKTRVRVRSSQPLTRPPRPNYPSTHADAPRCRRCPVTAAETKSLRRPNRESGGEGTGRRKREPRRKKKRTPSPWTPEIWW